MLPRLKFWHKEEYVLFMVLETYLYFFVEVDEEIRYAKAHRGHLDWQVSYVEHSRAEPHPLMEEKNDKQP